VIWEMPQPGAASSWGGTLATATGLVFVAAEGGSLMAVDGASGTPLWSFETGEVWRASPMTYRFDGRQYVAVAAGPNILARTLGGDRIIGGTTVAAGQFLDCVAVGSDSHWGCTGTLITPTVVLTAGHCASVATRVYVGGDVTRPGLVVNVKKRVRHPKYHVGKHNDLLVLILATHVQGVDPRPLARKTVIDKAGDGRAVGFGATDAAGTFGYGVKRLVDVPI